MSIELSGPLGYEIQYLATVWVALLAEKASPGAVSLRVEEKEDAEMTLFIDGEVLMLAMQSKYQQDDLDTETLASWLAHFSPRSAAESLLGRLLSEPSQLALFITRGDCTDFTRPFNRIHGDWNQHEASPLRTDQLQTLCAELSKAFDPHHSALSEARANECARLADQLRCSHQDCLSRILVWDRVTDQTITQAITLLLPSFRVPTSVADQVVDSLARMVREARDTRGELMPAIRQVLRENRADRVLHEQLHISRVEESDLLAELSEKRSLWLTGRAQSGKSHMARVLAQIYQDQGKECLETDDLKAARSFLTSEDLETKVVVLDDPLLLSEKPLAAWEAINKLAQYLPPQHRLIVTAKREHLIALCPTLRASVPDMFGNRWHDLTTTDRAFLESYWGRLAVDLKIPVAAVEKIERHIQEAREEELLQAGQLRHLAHRPSDELANQSDDGLLGIARFNAEQLASELWTDVETRRVALALGVAGSTKAGIGMREIAFILDVTIQGQDLEEELLGRMFSFGQGLEDEHSARAFPSYSASPVLSEDTRGHLRKLQRKGYISNMDMAAKVHFEHPDYREAFQRLVLRETSNDADDVIKFLVRSFEALDESVGISAARFISLWLPQVRRDAADTYARVVEIALRAVKRSIFPNVRTAVIPPLLREFGRLNREQEDELMRLASWSDSETKHVVWEGDVPWIHNSPDGWLNDALRTHRTLPAQDIHGVIARLASSNAIGTLTGAEADALNTAYLADDGPTPDSQVLRVLMNREEVFIRADAAHVAMSCASIEDSHVRQLVFADEHPIVVGRAVRTAFQYWGHLTGDLRAVVEQKICDALSDPVVASLSQCLFDMGDEYGSHDLNWRKFDEGEIRAVWNFWSRAVSAALRALAPRRFELNSGRFYNSTRVAANWISQEHGLLFSEAWLDWIEGQLAHSYLDDSCVALADFLLDVTQSCPQARNGLSERLLRLRGSDALARNMSDYIDRWSELTEHERELIRRLLCSDREDVEWLRAIALTRSQPPAVIVALITSKAGFFDLTAVEQVEVLPTSLLAKCVQLLTGDVGNGNQFGIPEAARTTWRTILDLYLLKPASPLFLLAVSDLLSRAAWRALNEPDLVNSWRQPCSTADKATRRILFRELLNQSLNFVGAQLDPIWAVFLALPLEADERTFYATEVAANLEGLGYKQHTLRDLGKLLGAEFLLREVLPLSEGDQFTYHLLLPLLNMGEEAETNAITLVETIYSTKPPRILDFHSMIQAWLKGTSATNKAQLLERVETCRLETIEKGSEQGQQRRPYEPHRQQWIAPEWN